MLTRKQHELLIFINDSLAKGGVSPSFEEMKDALNLRSKSGIHRLISALEERGFIRRLANRARALEVLKMPGGTTPASNVRLQTPPAAANDGLVELPLHGRIAAGAPIEALETSGTIAVPMAMLGAGEHYAIEVSGDSMVEAGILDGDYVLINRTQSARDGEIVVALIDNVEATLKYFRWEGSRIRLDPANPEYHPQRYDAARVRIQGRLAGLIRRY